MKLILMFKIKERYIIPNVGFVIQLKYFEEKLKENKYDLWKIYFNNCLMLNKLRKKFGY